MTKLIGKFGFGPWSEIQELLSHDKIEEALKLLPQSEDVMLLLVRFNGAKRQYSMGMIDFSEWSRIQNQIAYSVLSGVYSDIDRSNLRPEVTSPTTVNFSDVRIGDQVYVEPLGSGPYSGAGWETVTKVKTGDKSVVFKTKSQWFFQDGRPKTAPFGYGVSQLKNKVEL